MFFFISFLLVLNLFRQPILAVESTTNDSIDEKVDSLTDKLKQIVKGDSPTPTKILNNTPKAFFGSITQISDSQILLSVQNQTKTLKLNDKITYIDIKRQKSKLSNFKVGQTILAMGYINNDDESLDCRRIIATENKSIENSNQVVTGKIVDVSQSQTSPIFILIPFQNKNGQYQVKTDSKTETIDITQKKLTSSDVVVNGKKVITIIKPDTQSNQTFYASKIITLDISQPPTPTVKP